MSTSVSSIPDSNFEFNNLKSSEESTLDPPIKKKEFRSYSDASSTVKNTYHLNHTKQTFDYVKNKKSNLVQRLSSKSGPCHSIWEVLGIMDSFVDESDPDTNQSQMVHAIQCAEAARVSGYPEWFQVSLLIHDLGKYMGIVEQLDQWSVVGDIFVVGAEPANQVVYYEFFNENPDFVSGSIYNTKLGVYEENCGFENLHLSYGHDEYLYQVLKHSDTKLPEEGLYLIRFHSFYPWHRDFAYQHFASKKDFEMREMLQNFSKCDLYSKSDDKPDFDALKTHYQELISKYFPSKLYW